MKKHIFALFGLISLICLTARAAEAPAPSLLDDTKKFYCDPSYGDVDPVIHIGCSGIFPPHKAFENEMALLINGENSLAARLQTLNAAKTSIRIQALEFDGDESGRYISDILIRKHRDEQIPVKVITDALSNPSLKTQMMYLDLMQNGIEIEGYEVFSLQFLNDISFSLKDLSRLDKRFHDKMWLIDAEDPARAVAIVGGMNVGNPYFRVGEPGKKIWRDQDAIVRGPIIQDMIKTFDRNLAYLALVRDTRAIRYHGHTLNTYTRRELEKIVKKRGVINPAAAIKEAFEALKPNYLSQVKAAETRPLNIQFLPTKMRFIQSRPRFHEKYIEQAYVDLIENAHDHVTIVNAYFVPPVAITEAIKNAVRRGVKVTLLTNSPETCDLPPLTKIGRISYRGLLAAAKIKDETMRIFEWQGHQFGEGTIHAKFAIADSKIGIIGSYNLDPRSESLNSETVLYFENEALASELMQFIEQNDIRKSLRITTEMAEHFFRSKITAIEKILYPRNEL